MQHAYKPAYSPRKAFYLDRNRHSMLLKNTSRSMYARLLPGLLLSEIVTWGFLLLRGPRYWPVKLLVYRALWRERRMIKERRSAVQALRQRSDCELIGRFAYTLEFQQLANTVLAQAAAWLLHPAFRAAQWICAPPLSERVG